MAWDAPQVDLLFPASLDPAAGIALASACERHALGLDPRIKHSDGASFSSHTRITSYNVCYTKLLRSVRKPISSAMDI